MKEKGFEMTDFSMKEVEFWGGEKDDYEMLKDIDDGEEAIESKAADGADVDEAEIKQFLEKLKKKMEASSNTEPTKSIKKTSVEKPTKATAEKLKNKPVEKAIKNDASLVKAETITKVYEEGKRLFDKAVQKKAKFGWLDTLARSGTAHDKLAALTLKIQEDPLKNGEYLDSLVALVGKKSRRDAQQTLDAVKSVFLTSLLPDRKLLLFKDRAIKDLPSTSMKEKRNAMLVDWIYEEKLKQRYATFIKHVETLLHDPLHPPKKAALGTVYDLLVAKPEKELELVNMIINKLGDPDNKISTQASRLLLKLLEQHPNMKADIVIETEKFLFRPNLKARAQFNSICLLGQIALSPNDGDVAAKMVDIYFAFFKIYTHDNKEEKKHKSKKKKKEEKASRVDENKMLRSILSGVNRAVRMAKVDISKLKDRINDLFKLIHTVDFNTSIQALFLVMHISQTSTELTDRYYQALYRKMLDPALRTSSRQHLFLQLIMQSLQKDAADNRCKAVIKRLLQLCLQVPAPTFICAALITLSSFLRKRPHLLTLTQSGSGGGSTATGEEEEGGGTDEDEEEHFMDVDEPVDSGDEEFKTSKSAVTKATNMANMNGQAKGSSWIHRQNVKKYDQRAVYDPASRNPMFCHAEGECEFELQQLCQHYHPSVVLFASSILKGEAITYPGDPLEDFTLIRFLDRFSYKNPKKVKKGGDVGDQVLPNTSQYLSIPEKKIPVNEQFMHKFFKEQKAKLDFVSELLKAKAEKKKKKKGEEEEDEDEELGSSSDEDMDDFNDKDDEDVSFSITAKDMGFSSDEDELATDDEDDYDDEEDDDDEMEESTGKQKKRKGKLSADLLHSAEEFSELLDAGSTSEINMQISNAENASAKQLRWEMNRHWDFHIKDTNSKKQKKPLKRLQNKHIFKGKQDKRRNTGKFKRKGR